MVHSTQILYRNSLIIRDARYQILWRLVEINNYRIRCNFALRIRKSYEGAIWATFNSYAYSFFILMTTANTRISLTVLPQQNFDSVFINVSPSLCAYKRSCIRYSSFHFKYESSFSPLAFECDRRHRRLSRQPPYKSLSEILNLTYSYSIVYVCIL